jgi:hypothetical protein
MRFRKSYGGTGIVIPVKKSATGAEKTGIRRIPTGITNLVPLSRHVVVPTQLVMGVMEPVWLFPDTNTSSVTPSVLSLWRVDAHLFQAHPPYSVSVCDKLPDGCSPAPAGANQVHGVPP